MKTFKNYTVISFFFLTFECDNCNLNGILEDCEENSICWIRFENTSPIYSYDISIDYGSSSRLLPNEASNYCSVTALTYHTISWVRVGCNGNDCENSESVYLNKCESKTLKRPEF